MVHCIVDLSCDRDCSVRRSAAARLIAVIDNLFEQHCEEPLNASRSCDFGDSGSAYKIRLRRTRRWRLYIRLMDGIWNGLVNIEKSPENRKLWQQGNSNRSVAAQSDLHKTHSSAKSHCDDDSTPQSGQTPSHSGYASAPKTAKVAEDIIAETAN